MGRVEKSIGLLMAFDLGLVKMAINRSRQWIKEGFIIFDSLTLFRGYSCGYICIRVSLETCLEERELGTVAAAMGSLVACVSPQLVPWRPGSWSLDFSEVVLEGTFTMEHEYDAYWVFCSVEVPCLPSKPVKEKKKGTRFKEEGRRVGGVSCPFLKRNHSSGLEGQGEFGTNNTITKDEGVASHENPPLSSLGKGDTDPSPQSSMTGQSTQRVSVYASCVPKASMCQLLFSDHNLVWAKLILFSARVRS
eukprot:g38848.t1